MFKKIKKKWKKINEEQEKTDIERCRKHPRLYKSQMIFWPILFLAIGIYILFVELSTFPIFILIIFFIIYFEREIWKIYRKAFPK